MVLYKGYCRPLGKKVDFNVEDVISMNTKRGIKWRVKGKFEDYNISTFCSAEIAQEILSKLPLRMDAEIAYTPPSNTYEAEELLPLFSNATKKADEIEAEEETIEVHEQIQENTNAQELKLQSEKLPSKYYKKDGSLDMRYTICREFAAKQAESQNAVELEAPYTPIKPERPSDDYDGGGRHRKKPRRPLGAEDMITVTEIDWETDGEDIDLPTTMDVPADLEEDEIADYLSDQKGWLVNGFVMGAESFGADSAIGDVEFECSSCKVRLDPQMEEAFRKGCPECGANFWTIVPEEDKRDAESFEAAYTPEQRLDDYTPEQLTTSSAVTGDFFEDSLKYSYGGFQAETEELGETSYAEDVPALQRAEAGMEVEDIEKAYMKKEDQFMTLVVDDATLFRLAPELPAFVEMENTQLAGYTSLKFNFVENPEMEQQILSYAINVVDDKGDEEEEPEFKEGDVRNRLFNVEFDDWAEQEMLTHGKDVSFKEWADEESESHGDEEFMDWAKHEEESHDERYEAESGRNVSDFEMGNIDRYKIGDEIIALSSALKNMGDWDWRNVKKIGKGIKQGNYERIKNHMADIDLKTRRVLWDKHHNDFFEIFTDEQIRGLAIPWVVKEYEAEITDDDLSKLEGELDRKIDSYVKGLNYTQCVACDKEAKVEILEDKDGNPLYHFYSCECGHNDIQDSSYDAESANKYQLMAEEVGGLYQVLNNRGFKIEFENGYELSVMIGAGTYSDNYDMSPIAEMGRGLESSTAEIAVIHNGLMLPLDETGGSTVIGYVPTSVLPSLIKAVSNGDIDEIRNVVGQFKGGDFDVETFEAPPSVKGMRATMKKRKQKLMALYEELEQRDNDLKDKHDSDIATHGKVLGDKKFRDRIEMTERKILKQIDSIGELQAKIDATFKLGKRDSKVLKQVRSNDPTANTTSERTYRFDHRYSGSAMQRRLLKRKAEESFEAPTREIKKRKLCDTCHKQRLTPSASNDGVTTCATCTRRGLSKRAESFEADGFIGRIPKSKSMEEKTEILKNNVKIIFEQAQRPLYPMEVMTLYEQKKYGDKPQRKSKYKSSPRAKKLGITQKKLSQIINSQKDKYYVSRRGLIHYIGEGSMQDYIKNLDPKYFAEDDSKSYNYLPNEDDILKYLEQSHRSIRKYNAPYRYSSKGMAEKFGVSQDAMRGRMGRMERAGKVKSTPRRCEDGPKQYMKSRLKIYYLPDKRLMGAEERYDKV